jgi:long-chain acyl-CoA synthetase
MDSVRLIMQFLKDNKSVLIPPEGTRSETGEIGDFNPSFIKLALKANALIVPVGIKGTNKAMPKGATFPCPYKVTLRVGKSIDLSTYPPEQLHKNNYENLATQLRQTVIDLAT